MNAFEITTLLFLSAMYCVKNLILSETAFERCSAKQELPLSRSYKVAGFWPLITTAMRPIGNAAGLLNPTLAFSYKKNDGHFNFKAISVFKVYIDF